MLSSQPAAPQHVPPQQPHQQGANALVKHEIQTIWNSPWFCRGNSDLTPVPLNKIRIRPKKDCDLGIKLYWRREIQSGGCYTPPGNTRNKMATVALYPGVSWNEALTVRVAPSRKVMVGFQGSKFRHLPTSYLPVQACGSRIKPSLTVLPWLSCFKHP